MPYACYDTHCTGRYHEKLTVLQPHVTLIKDDVYDFTYDDYARNHTDGIKRGNFSHLTLYF